MMMMVMETTTMKKKKERIIKAAELAENATEEPAARQFKLERHSILQRRSGVSKRPAEAAARYALCTPQLVTKCGRALAE